MPAGHSSDRTDRADLPARSRCRRAAQCGHTSSAIDTFWEATSIATTATPGRESNVVTPVGCRDEGSADVVTPQLWSQLANSRRNPPRARSHECKANLKL